jgi:hypothetical protein
MTKDQYEVELLCIKAPSYKKHQQDQWLNAAKGTKPKKPTVSPSDICHILSSSMNKGTKFKH